MSGLPPSASIDHFAEVLQRRLARKASKRGFAAMPAERQRELSSMGGKRRGELGVGHQFSPDEASIAGLVTGLASTEKMLRSIDANLAEFDSVEQMLDAARKYIAHREGAAVRGIGFEFTFAEWWSIWKNSGHWEQRGSSSGDSYVMARRGDVGPYKVGNVYIATLSQNIIDAWASSPRMAHRRRKAKAAPSSPL